MGRRSAADIQGTAEVLLDQIQSLDRSSKAYSGAVEALQAALLDLSSVNNGAARKSLGIISVSSFQVATAQLKQGLAGGPETDALISIATKAVDCLYRVRDLIKGGTAHVELQHYSLVRLLATQKHFRGAFTEASKLLTQLSDLLNTGPTLQPLKSLVPATDAAGLKPKAAEAGTQRTKRSGKSTTQTPPPESRSQKPSKPIFPIVPVGAASGPAQEIASVVVGTLLTILMALAVMPCKEVTEPSLFVCRHMPQVQAWLQLLPEGELGKQQEHFFRCTFKVVMAVLPGAVKLSDMSQAEQLFAGLCSAALHSPSATKLPQVMGRVMAAIPIRRQTKFLTIAFDQCFGLPARPQEILLGMGDYLTASQSQWESVEVSRLLHEFARRDGGGVLGLYGAGFDIRNEIDGDQPGCLARSLEAATHALQIWTSSSSSPALGEQSVALGQAVLRALNYLRKSIPKDGIGGIDAKHVPAVELHTNITQIMMMFPSITQALAGEPALLSKYAYNSASALVLALSYLCEQWIADSGDAAGQPVLNVCAPSSVTKMLSFYVPGRGSPVLKIAEIQWLLTAVHCEACKLADAGLNCEAGELLLACFKAAERLLDSDVELSEVELEEITLLATSVAVATAESIGSIDVVQANQVCMSAASRLARSQARPLSALRVLLAFACGPAGYSSMTQVIHGLLSSDDEGMHQLVVREACQVAWLSFQDGVGEEDAKVSHDRSAGLFEVLEKHCMKTVACEIQLLHMQAAFPGSDGQSLAHLAHALSCAETAHQDVHGDESLKTLGTCHALLALTKAGLAQSTDPLGDTEAAATNDIWQEICNHVQAASTAWAGFLGSTENEARACDPECHDQDFLCFLADQLAVLSDLQGWVYTEQLLVQAKRTKQQLADLTGTRTGSEKSGVDCLMQSLELAIPSRSFVKAGADPENGLYQAKASRHSAFMLAASGSNDCTVIAERACLHHRAALHFQEAGNVCEAMYDADEALRLSGSLFASSSSAAPYEPQLLGVPGSLDELGSWNINALYLASLAQTGRLWEKIGFPTESSPLLREGAQLAKRLGCQILNGGFMVHIAKMEIRCGHEAKATSALDAANEALFDNTLSSHIAPSLRLQHSTAAILFAAKFKSLQEAESLLEIAADVCMAEKILHDEEAAQLLQKAHESRSLLQAELYFELGEIEAARTALSTLAELNPAQTAGLSEEQTRAEVLRLRIQLASSANEHTDFVDGASLLVKKQTLSNVAAEAASSSDSKTSRQPSSRRRVAGKAGRKPQITQQSRDKDTSPEAERQVVLLKMMWQLLELHGNLQHNPVTSRNLSRLIFHISASLGLPWTAAFFLHCAHGISLRLQMEAIECSNFNRQIKDGYRRCLTADDQLSSELDLCPSMFNMGEFCALAKKACLKSLEAEAKGRMQSLLQALPHPYRLCSISADRKQWWQTSGEQDMLVVSVCHLDRQPLLLGLAASNTPQESISSCVHQLNTILEKSAATMSKDHPDEDIESRRAWWHKRVALDLEMDHLLSSMESDLLGPWRHLLKGDSSETANWSSVSTELHASLTSQSSGSAVSRASPLLPYILEMMEDLTEAEVALVSGLLAAEYDIHEPDEVQDALRRCRPASAGEHFDFKENKASAAQGMYGPNTKPNLKDKKSSDQTKAAETARKPRTAMKHTTTTPVQEPGKPLNPSNRRVLRFDMGEPSQKEQLRAGDACGLAKSTSASDAPLQEKRIPSTPLRERDLPNGEAFKTPGKGLATTRRTARKTGLMSRMRQVREGACDSPAIPPTAKAQTRQSRFAPPPQAERTAKEDLHDRVSETDSDAEPDLLDFTLHRGTTTTMAQLSSRMRGMALETEDRDPVITADSGRDPVVLVLDSVTQALPWESMPALRAQNLWRIPSLHCAALQASAREASQVAAGSEAAEEAASSTGCSRQHDLDLDSTFYLLNPGGDLSSTQATFESLFTSQPLWKGHSGAACSQAELLESLQARDLYIYCGHGCGEQFISARSLRQDPGFRKHPCCAAFVMGCSSGRLAPLGDYESSGFILAYMLAGCPGAVANLWDVTDRDIDRFSRAVLESWIAKPELHKAGDWQEAHSQLSIMPSRGKCRLPHLIGAAPVCYGLPLKLRQSKPRTRL